MSAFGVIPKEPPRSADVSRCAPRFAEKIARVIQRMEQQGYDPIVYEAGRSEERQVWLHGFSREYDDGRGCVTHAATAFKAWHIYGLAVDIISRSKGWDAPDGFWACLRTEAEAEGLEAGAKWKMADKPHVQWAPMRTTPSDHAKELYDAEGVEAVWKEVGAV